MTKQMREEKTHLDLRHLNNQEDDWDSQDLDLNPEDEFEDEEDRLDDAELEKELGEPIPEPLPPVVVPPQVVASPAAVVVTPPVVVAPVVVTPQVDIMDAEVALKQINEWRNNLPRLKNAVQKKIDNLNAERKKLDEQEAELRNQLNYLNMMTAPVAAMQTSQPAKRRGRKPKSESTPVQPPAVVESVPEDRTVNIPVPTPVTATTEVPVVTPPAVTDVTTEEKPRKRPRNENNWKISIAKSLLMLKHPTTGQANTADIHEIVKKVVLPKELGGMGYRHTSGNQSSLTSNARVQISRLLDDGWVVKNADKTFTLTDKALQEVVGK